MTDFSLECKASHTLVKNWPNVINIKFTSKSTSILSSTSISISTLLFVAENIWLFSLESKTSQTLVTNWPNLIISININGNNDLKIEISINININIIISWCKYSNSLSGKHRESHRGDKLSMSGKWVKRLTLYFSVGIQECLVRARLSRKYSPWKYKPNS